MGRSIVGPAPPVWSSQLGVSLLLTTRAKRGRQTRKAWSSENYGPGSSVKSRSRQAAYRSLSSTQSEAANGRVATTGEVGLGFVDCRKAVILARPTQESNLLYMIKRSTKKLHPELDRPDQVFEVAADLFKLLSAPMRLKIVS